MKKRSNSGSAEKVDLLLDGGKKKSAASSSKLQRTKLAMISKVSQYSDYATVLISMSDIVSDIAVAYQFYSDGHILWFCLVAFSLVISSFCYTCIWGTQDCMPSYLPGKKWRYWPRMVLIFFCYSQLIPIFEWYEEGKKLQTKIAKAKEKKDADDARLSAGMIREQSREQAETLSKLEGGVKAGGQAVVEELDTVLDQGELMESMQGSLKDHISSHYAFYIEAVVEAIPQSVIQLLAVTYLGQASYWQLFSMCLSLSSIVSKAYVLSVASDLKVFFFRFLLCAHDVFSLFYICSTIIASNHRHDDLTATTADQVYVPLLGTIVTSALNGWLLRKVMYLPFLITTTGILFAFLETRKELVRVGIRQYLRAHAIPIILFVVGFLVLGVPLLIVFEAVKLIILVFLLLLSEPSNLEGYPAGLAARTFVRNAKDSAEYKERARHLLSSVMKQYYRVEKEKKYGKRATVRARKHAVNPTRKMKVLREMLEKINSDKWTIYSLFWENLDLGKGFATMKTFLTTPGSTYYGKPLFIWSFFVLFPMYLVGLLYSVVFPFINFYHHGSEQNLYQNFCFGCLTVSLLGALFLLKDVIPAWKAMIVLQPLLSGSHIPAKIPEQATLSDMASYISQYHRPTVAQVMQCIIPQHLIPYDLNQHTSAFLVGGGVPASVGHGDEEQEQPQKNPGAVDGSDDDSSAMQRAESLPSFLGREPSTPAFDETEFSIVLGGLTLAECKAYKDV